MGLDLRLEDIEPVERSHVDGYGRDTPYMLASIFFAILAYPAESEWGRRDEFMSAIYAFRVKKAIKRGYLDRESVAKSLTSLPNQQIYGRMQRVQSRVEKRIKAAEITNLVDLKNASNNLGADNRVEFKLDSNRNLRTKHSGGGGGIATITSVISEYTNARNMDASHTMQTTWSASIPVIHFAHALWHTLMNFASKAEVKDESGRPMPFAWDIPLLVMLAEDWIYETVDAAEKSRVLYPALNGILPRQTIQLTYEKP